MSKTNPTTGERLATIETLLNSYDADIKRNGENIFQNGVKAEKVLAALSDKLDEMDQKWDARFTSIEKAAFEDSAELQNLKSRGLGLLTGLGIVFTAGATFFSDFFSQIKTTIFG